MPLIKIKPQKANKEGGVDVLRVFCVLCGALVKFADSSTEMLCDRCEGRADD